MNASSITAPHLPPASIVRVVGCDDGYAAIKLAWFELRAGRRAIQTFSMPSVAQKGAGHTSTVLGDAGIAYETSEGVFTVNSGLAGLSTQFADYPVSGLNRALVHHALMQAGHGGMQLRLATGLPPGLFFNAGKINRALVDAKKQSLLEPITLVGRTDARSARIAGHDVYAEAVCAVIDWSLDEIGNEINTLDGPIAVVDIGGRTTDVVVIVPGENGMRVDHDRSGTETIGMLKLYNTIRDLLVTSGRFTADELAGVSMDKAVRTGTVRMYGKDEDVSQIVEHATEEIGGTLIQIIQRRLSRGADLERILAVGGGAKVFERTLRGYRNAVQIQNPEFANARGFLKAASYLS